MTKVLCDVAECAHNFGGKCSAHSVTLKLKGWTDMKCKSFYRYTVDPKQIKEAAIATEERERDTAKNIKRFFDYMRSNGRVSAFDGIGDDWK